MESATAFWTVAPLQGELRQEALPACGEHDVLVSARYSGISLGTEALVFRGGVPASERFRMRAPFQQGTFPGPVKYGYSSVGSVVDGDASLVGRTVFCLYPHQDRYVVPASAVVEVPPSVPPRRAVLAANMETALNALWDAGPTAGDRVTVVGAGALGCLLASLLVRSLALDVEVVDVQPARSRIVEQVGARFADPGGATPERDLVFHTSASAAGIAHCIDLCRSDGNVIELSWYGDRDVQVPLGAAFHSRRITLRSSQVGTVSPRRSGWTHRQRLTLALSLLDDARLDALLAPPIPLSSLATLLTFPERLAESAPCCSVEYPPWT